MKMKTGKLEWGFMTKILSLLPIHDVDLIMGPSQGEDAAVIRIRDGFLVIHSNPITTGVKRAGYLAIHVAANDIAVRGVKPKWFLPVVLFPDKIVESDILEFFEDMNRAIRELNGIIVGGHTEITPGIPRPLVSMTAIGYTTSRVILTRDAKPGDYVYVIGRIGGEGVGIIAWDFENTLIQRNIDIELIKLAKEYIYDISVVKVALEIRDYVNSMHDATEGGVLQALREIASASKTSISIDRGEIELDESVKVITSALNIDPLKLLSSGCLVATTSPNIRRDLENRLEQLNKRYHLVGRVQRGGEGVVVVKDGGGEMIVDRDIIDEIYKLWE